MVWENDAYVTPANEGDKTVFVHFIHNGTFSGK